MLINHKDNELSFHSSALNICLARKHISEQNTKKKKNPYLEDGTFQIHKTHNPEFEELWASLKMLYL